MPDEEQKQEETQPEAPVVEAELEKAEGFEIKIADLRPGMTIRIHEKIHDVAKDGKEKDRIQIFQGIIASLRGGGPSKTMTIRRVSKGWGVEKIYPLNTPVIAKVELVKTAQVRRAKLSFLSDLRHPFKRKLKETWTELSK